MGQVNIPPGGGQAHESLLFCMTNLCALESLQQHIRLMTNLRHLGLSSGYVLYEIVGGDPAYMYAILSDPVVTLAMVL
ncbi:hypothetical protein AC1031_009633 [Aphanomyces cochlioides]|nr:hypothetical protein AC1031_009633 [Aphanomyces cochlioides]